MNVSTTRYPDFQLVPVPAQHVMSVMRFLADLESDTPAVSSAFKSETPDVAWDDEALSRFASAEAKALRILTNIIDILSTKPGTWMNLDDIAKKSEWDRPTLKGVWTHGTRAMKAHYEGRKLPLETAFGPTLQPALDAVRYYRVTADQAAQWKRVRSN
jgi:hypothetical protein